MWFKRCNHDWKEVTRYFGEWRGLSGGGLLTRIVFRCGECNKYTEREIPGHVKED